MATLNFTFTLDFLSSAESKAPFFFVELHSLDHDQGFFAVLGYFMISIVYIVNFQNTAAKITKQYVTP